MSGRRQRLTALYVATFVVVAGLAGISSPAFVGAAAAGNAGNVDVTAVQVADTAPYYTDANVTVDVTVKNTGGSSATKLVTVNSTSGYGYARQVAAKTVTVAGGTSKTVPVNVSFEDAADETISAGGQSASTITIQSNPVSITDVAYSTTATGGGMKVIATATLANKGDATQEKLLELEDGYTEIRQETVTLSGGETRSVSLNGTVSVPGVHAVHLEARNATKVSVDDPRLSLNGFSVSPTSTYDGVPVSVTTTVNYTGSTSTPYVYSVWSNGTWQRQSYLHFSGAGEKSETVDIRFFRPGTYGVRVNDASAETVTVKEAVNVTGFDVETNPPYYTGEQVSVNVTVVNRASVGKSEYVTATGYRQRDSKWQYVDSDFGLVSLNGSETKYVTRTLTFDEPGATRISVAGINETIEVERNPVQVRNVRFGNTTISSGAEAQIEVTLENTGSSAASRTIRLFDGRTFSGTKIAKRTVQVSGNATKTVPFTPKLSAGVHELRVAQQPARKVVVTDPSLSVTGIALSESTVYAGDRITVTATVENAGSSKARFTSGVWTGAEYDVDGERLSTRLNRTVLDPGETKQVRFTVRLDDPGTTNLTVNNASTRTVTVKRAVTTDVALSDQVLTNGETGYVNVTLSNTIASDRTKYLNLFAPPNSASKQVTVPADSKKQVSFPVSYSESGAHPVFVNGVQEQVFVLEDSTGAANITVDGVFAPDTVVKGEKSNTYIGVRVTNDGDASGVRNVTVSVGSRTWSQQVYLDPGESDVAYIPVTFPSTGQFTGSVGTTDAGSFNDANASSSASFNVSVRAAVVTDVSIEHVGGTKPSKLPSIDATFQGGHVFFQITTGSGYNYDLADIGADRTTTFRINVTLDDYTPRVLLSNGRGLDWETRPGPTSNTTNVSITVQPARWDIKTRFNGSRPQTPSQWESSVDTDVADLGFDAAIFAALGTPQGDLLETGVSAEDVTGMTLSTDAQLFTMPRYVRSSPNASSRLTFGIAGPHKTVNGNVNDGYYRVFLPDGLLDAWNVSNPETALNVSYSGGGSNIRINETNDGAWVNLTVHYSAGTVSVAADTASPTADAGANRTVDVGTAVQFDASGSTDNRRIASYEWDVDGDGTYERSGANVSYTYSTTGERTVTVRVTDAAGNVAVDTLTVVVESTSGGPTTDSNETSRPDHDPVEVTRSDGSARVTVWEPSGEMSVDVSPASRRGNVSADVISFETDTDGSFTLAVSSPATAPSDVPTPAATAVGGDPLGYLRIDHSVPNSALSNVTLRFNVGWDALSSVDAEDVVLYRYHDGRWAPLKTEVVEFTDAGALMEAETPGLSVFAVGLAKAPALTVADASPNLTRVTVDEAATVRVTVENTGTANGTMTVALSADGRVRATETVTVAPGASATVDLSVAFESAGEYALSVNGTDAGTVTVESEVTATTTPTPTPTATPTPTSAATATPEPMPTSTPTPTASATAPPESTPTPTASATAPPESPATASADGPGFGVGLTLVALVLSVLAAARTRR
ncbi:MAG: PKD domain-containing protein [Halobaculum sp.]